MSELNKQVTLKFIEAMGSNDPQGAAETLADNARTITMGYSKFSGERSKDLVVGAIESFKGLFPTGLRLRIKSVTAEGDRVVVEAEGNAVTGDGDAYENQYCFIATLEDGRIVEFHEYLCTALAERVLWPMVERVGALKIEDA